MSGFKPFDPSEAINEKNARLAELRAELGKEKKEKKPETKFGSNLGEKFREAQEKKKEDKEKTPKESAKKPEPLTIRPGGSEREHLNPDEEKGMIKKSNNSPETSKVKNIPSEEIKKRVIKAGFKPDDPISAIKDKAYKLSEGIEKELNSMPKQNVNKAMIDMIQKISKEDKKSENDGNKNGGEEAKRIRRNKKAKFKNGQKKEREERNKQGTDATSTEGKKKPEKGEKPKEVLEMSPVELNSEGAIVNLEETHPGERKKEDEELERLKKEIEEARNAYAKKNYELTNIFERLKESLRSNLKTRQDEIDDSKILFSRYKNTLNDYRDYQTENIKGQNLSPEEVKKRMEELVKFFNQDEKIELFDARTKVRAEYLEEKMGTGIGKPVGWVMNGAKKFFHWYVKSEGQGKKGFAKGIAKRSSINMALAGAGILIAVPGAGLGFVAARRVLGGVATGVGVARYQEGRYRKKEEQKMTEERKEIITKFETDSTEDKYKNLTQRLNSEMDGYENDIERELWNATKRKMIGLSAGAISAVVLPEVFKFIEEKTGFFHNIVTYYSDLYGKYFGQGLNAGLTQEVRVKMELPEKTTPLPSAVQSGMAEPSSPEASMPPPAPSADNELINKGPRPLRPLVTTEVVPKMEIADLTVEKGKGGSFQGAIIKYLTQHGVEKGEAGKMAYRMWDNFSEEFADPGTDDYNTIQPGSKLEIGLDPDGHYKVLAFQDGKTGSDWIGDTKDVADKAAQDLNTASAVEKNIERPSARVPEGLPEDMKEELTGNKNVEAALDRTDVEPLVEDFKPGETGERAVNSTIASNEAGLIGASVAGGLAVKKGVEAIKNRGKVIDIAEKRKEKRAQKIDERREKRREKALKKLSKYGFKVGQNPFERASEIIKKGISVSNRLRWAEIKKENVSKVIKDNKEMEKIEKELIKYLGEDAKHERGEKFMPWLARNVKETIEMEKGSVKLKEAA